MRAVCSGEKTADAAVFAAKCAITAIYIITDGTNDAKLVIHDHASAASGTVVHEQTIKGSDHYGGLVLPFPKSMENGIYCNVTGTGASYIIDFIPG